MPRPYDDTTKRPSRSAAVGENGFGFGGFARGSAQAERTEQRARSEEMQRDTAQADARRAEEATALAQEEAEKLSRKDKKAREKADREAAEADHARKEADEAERLRLEADERSPDTEPSKVSAASLTSPVGAQTSPRAAASAAAGATAARPPATGAADVPVTERPEVLVGAAFAGAFLFARILKAVTSDD